MAIAWQYPGHDRPSPSGRLHGCYERRLLPMCCLFLGANPAREPDAPTRVVAGMEATMFVTRSVPPGRCSVTDWAPKQVSPTLVPSISPASGTASRIGPARGLTPNTDHPPTRIRPNRPERALTAYRLLR